jgi:hypothetical protein
MGLICRHDDHLSGLVVVLSPEITPASVNNLDDSVEMQVPLSPASVEGKKGAVPMPRQSGSCSPRNLPGSLSRHVV